MADHSFDNYAGGGTLLDADGGTLLLDYEQTESGKPGDYKNKLPRNTYLTSPFKSF